MYAMILAGTAAVLWGAQEAARSQSAPVHWRTVVVHEPPPVPVAQVPMHAQGADFDHARDWDASPSRLAAFAIEPGGQIRVFDFRTGRPVANLRFSSGVSAASWVSDRLLLILTGGDVLETYDVWNHVLRYIASLHPPPGMACRALAFSGYTNDLYVIFSGPWGNEAYYFDTNEHMYTEVIGSLPIRQAYYGATDLTLYVVDAEHRLWTYRGGTLRLVGSGVALIRGAGNSVYCAALNPAGDAVAIRAFDGSGWKAICRLPSPVPVSSLVIDHDGHPYVVTPRWLEDGVGRAVVRAPQGAAFIASQGADAVVVANGRAYGVAID